MKKILSSSILILFVFVMAGCNLVREVPENSLDGNTQQNPSGGDMDTVTDPAAEEVLSPSDHIFDINTVRLKEDLAGKTFGVNEEWVITAEEIVDTEFGGSSLANNKMESTYYITLQKSGASNKTEVAVTVNYDWDKNHWVFKEFQQIYFEQLAEGVDTLEREVRQQKILEFQNQPAVPQVPEVPGEETEDEAVEEEGVGGEEIVEETNVEEEEGEEVLGEEIVEEANTPDEEVIEEGENTEEEVVEEQPVEEEPVEEEPVDEGEDTEEEVTQ